MTNQVIHNYGRALYELAIPEEVITESRKILEGTPELTECLSNPTVSKKEKGKIIDRIFQEKIHNFLKVACDHQEIGRIIDIFQAYDRCVESQRGILRAQLTYMTAPDKRQEEGICSFIKKEFGATEVKLSGTKDESLLGGFILKVGSREYDWSTKGKLKRLESKLTSR